MAKKKNKVTSALDPEFERQWICFTQFVIVFKVR